MHIALANDIMEAERGRRGGGGGSSELRLGVRAASVVAAGEAGRGVDV